MDENGDMLELQCRTCMDAPSDAVCRSSGQLQPCGPNVGLSITYSIDNEILCNSICSNKGVLEMKHEAGC